MSFVHLERQLASDFDFYIFIKHKNSTRKLTASRHTTFENIDRVEGRLNRTMFILGKFSHPLGLDARIHQADVATVDKLKIQGWLAGSFFCERVR